MSFFRNPEQILRSAMGKLSEGYCQSPSLSQALPEALHDSRGEHLKPLVAVIKQMERAKKAGEKQWTEVRADVTTVGQNGNKLTVRGYADSLDSIASVSSSDSKVNHVFHHWDNGRRARVTAIFIGEQRFTVYSKVKRFRRGVTITGISL